MKLVLLLVFLSFGASSQKPVHNHVDLNHLPPCWYCAQPVDTGK